ncbi:MAG: hypothetical protein QOG15_2869 [Solirubrobacteraceae bacterium]|nr:hypothetical protein [Solirubrobacteraceae bacterium]
MSDVLTRRTAASGRAAAGDAVLSPRALNRALLERQFLLRREDLSVAEVLAHLVGLQAQNPNAPYVALWSRLADFDPEDFSELVVARKVVRVALMRWTLHAVTARDCRALRPVVQPVIDRRMKAGFGRHLADLDIDALVQRARTVVEHQPHTFGDIGRVLATEWTGHEPRVLANVVSARVALVHVPPRGLWGRNGRAIQTTAERWLGRPLERSAQPDELILRYLAAFGPASVADIRTWSGLTGLAPAIARLRPQLRSFRDVEGRELLDVVDGRLPDPGTPAPPRFLDCDNAVLAHADRSRVMATPRRRLTSPRTFLLDGFVAGTWRLIRGRRLVTLELTPFQSIARDDRVALAEEGMALLSFLTAPTEDGIRVTVTFLD